MSQSTSRKRTSVKTVLSTGLATGGVVAATAAFALIAGSSASQAGGVPSEAYAVGGSGALPIDKTPYVVSSDGKKHSSSAVELPDNQLVSLRAGTVTAGANSASVELTDVSVGGDALASLPKPPQELKEACAELPANQAPDAPLPDDQLPDLGLPGVSVDDLPADSLPELCELLLTPPDSVLGVDALDVWCRGKQGGVDLGTLSVLGQPVDLPASPKGTTVPAGPLGTITINKQSRNADGSFTVTGIEVNLGGGQQKLTLAQASCGSYRAASSPTHPTNSPTPTAPSPTPIRTNHPVTG